MVSAQKMCPGYVMLAECQRDGVLLQLMFSKMNGEGSVGGPIKSLKILARDDLD